MDNNSSFFTSPFAFGLDVSQDHYVTHNAADAAADVAESLHEEEERVVLTNWVIDIYGVNVDVDNAFVHLLQELPNTAGKGDRLAKHLANRGNCNHYPPDGSAMNHSTNSKKTKPAGKNNQVNIPAAIAGAGGKIIGDTRNSRARVMCSSGHVCQLLPTDTQDWCALCKCLVVLNATEVGSIKFIALTHLFGSDMRLFRIKCPRGHEFVTTVEDAAKGCPSCRVEKLIKDTSRLKMSILSAYEHKRSVLRIRCENCKLVFYTSEKSIDGGEILSCDSQHVCNVSVEKYIIMIRHFLELLFRVKFDDIMSDEKVYFDAFSIRYRLACIFEGNPVTSKYLTPARRWCAMAGVKLLVIPKKVTCSRDIVMEIIRQLVVVDLVSIVNDDVVEELADFLLSIYASMCRQHRPLYVTF